MNSIQLSKITQRIKQYAIQELGFSFCGIAKAEFLSDEAPRLESWLKQSLHGEMSYMTNHFDKRLDPTLLVDNARSVITLMHNYYPPHEDKQAPYKISKYAYGRDYHKVIKSKLKKLLTYIQSELGQVQGRGFVDSAPVLERAWAQRSGLGWIGKNAMLINKGHGSFYFLSTLIIDVDLEFDSAMKTDHCGTCTRCIDACPTQAITAPMVIDSNKCISYLTIELKKQSIPEEISYQDWVFGCDVCQDVCPWNRFSSPHQEADFDIRAAVENFNIEKVFLWSTAEFDEHFNGSPIKRTGLEGLKRNILHVKK